MSAEPKNSISVALSALRSNLTIVPSKKPRLPRSPPLGPDQLALGLSLCWPTRHRKKAVWVTSSIPYQRGTLALTDIFKL